MDADRIRQALANTIGLTLDDPETDADQEVLRAAALAHADWLEGRDAGSASQPFDNGPTDEDVEVARGACSDVWPYSRITTSEIEFVLEAAFQARKERG